MRIETGQAQVEVVRVVAQVGEGRTIPAWVHPARSTKMAKSCFSFSSSGNSRGNDMEDTNNMEDMG